MDPKILKLLDEEFGKSNIFQKICNQDKKGLLECIKEGDNIHLACKNTGMSYLHVVVNMAMPTTETTFVPMVYQLSNAGINLDAVDKSDVPALQLSIKKSLLELMAAILKCGATANPERDELVFDKLIGPCKYEVYSWYRKFALGFWDAVENDKAFKVNVLVKSWFRINISKNGKSLIEYAKECNCCDKIMHILITNEVTMDFVHTTIAGDEDKMIYFLSHYPVDVQTRDLSHRSGYFEAYSPLTLYGAAQMYGHEHLLKLLADLEKDPKHYYNFQSKPSRNTESSICVIS